MSDKQPADSLSEMKDQEEPNASSPLSETGKTATRDPSKKRAFDTFYLFCVALLALAIGTQILAIALYN